MLLGRYYDGVEVHREAKMIYAKFLAPHRVISTCRAAGGMADDLQYMFNHQSCEPSGHQAALPPGLWRDARKYREIVAGRQGLPADKCATLGTAANMHNAAIAQESFREHDVVAVATGGVECNAGRVGDPALSYEKDGEFLRLDGPEPPPAGTINTMLFIGQELASGALVRSIVTATEAKTAVLQELAVNSRYSPGLATGTGTDQIAVACRLGTGSPLSGAGKHSKLGELIGRTVKSAIAQTLALQNKLTPAGQCSARIHLERFGASKDIWLEAVCGQLDEMHARLLRANFREVDRDPPTVAAVAALVHLWDKLAWGVLPASCRPEIGATYAAQVAAAVSGRYERLADYRQRLALLPGQNEPGNLLKLAAAALALGFADKWGAGV
jgi:adenosylcobinamide amidohydrolase